MYITGRQCIPRECGVSYMVKSYVDFFSTNVLRKLLNFRLKKMKIFIKSLTELIGVYTAAFHMDLVSVCLKSYACFLTFHHVVFNSYNNNKNC